MNRRHIRNLSLPLWPSLVAVAVVTLLVQLPGPHATAWHFFDDAADLLLGRGPEGLADGLHLYRDRPDLQFGPLSIAAALPFSLAGPDAGAWLAMLAASVAGLLTYRLLLDVLETVRPGFRQSTPPGILLAGGAVVVVTWGDVAVRTAHIDDALTWLAVAAALRWCVRRRPWLATLALATAAAAKPWAIMFAPLALAASDGPTCGPTTGDELGAGADGKDSVGTGSGRRQPVTLRTATRVGWRWLVTHRSGLTRMAAVGLLAGVTWLPFVAAEPATLDTSEFSITNDDTSVLRALGVTEAQTPAWARPAQLAGGLALVTLIVASGRWPAAVLAGVAWRLLLEPGANRYYTVGLVLGALVLELLGRRDKFPVWTVAAAVALEATAVPGFPGEVGRYVRLGCTAAALALVWWYPAGRDDGAGTTTTPLGHPAEPVTR